MRVCELNALLRHNRRSAVGRSSSANLLSVSIGRRRMMPFLVGVGVGVRARVWVWVRVGVDVRVTLSAALGC